jgi:sec-independent protein translocase protein TatC
MNADTIDSDETSADPLPEMSLLEHLTELRRRVVVSLVAFVVAMLACWAVSDRIFDILTAPVVRLLPADADRLVFTSLTEPFVLYLKVAAVAGLFLASPVLIYHAWMFVAPGLYRRERSYAVPVVFASVACFLLGGLFGYKILFPIMADFFLSLGADFRQLLTVNNLFSFLLRTLLGCALIFEWPIVVFFLARLGLLTAGGMWRNFRYAILIIFIVAAVVTPTPDFATQTILAIPMLLLYVAGIGIAWAVQPRE